MYVKQEKEAKVIVMCVSLQTLSFRLAWSWWALGGCPAEVRFLGIHLKASCEGCWVVHGILLKGCSSVGWNWSWCLVQPERSGPKGNRGGGWHWRVDWGPWAQAGGVLKSQNCVPGVEGGEREAGARRERLGICGRWLSKKPERCAVPAYFSWLWLLCFLNT